ncbi:hypothetical protein HanRHA438_Chr08g0366451 [Helianthus annuus]|nr:hypothetical protein HanRHA438_Chr08g0366451 [Helianthus annuus]
MEGGSRTVGPSKVDSKRDGPAVGFDCFGLGHDYCWHCFAGSDWAYCCFGYWTACCYVNCWSCWPDWKKQIVESKQPQQ